MKQTFEEILDSLLKAYEKGGGRDIDAIIADMEALFIENDFTNATENAYWITKDKELG